MGKKTGVILIILGAAMIGGSVYINKEVAAGREQISDAEKKAKMGESLFSLSPITKDIGEGANYSIQKKIRAGEVEASKYAKIARWLQIGGIVALALGVWALLRKKA